MAATTISMEGAEINYSQLPDTRTNDTTSNLSKYLEFFLQGSIHDNALELVKQRLTALCGEGDELFELESIYVLGDGNSVKGLEYRPMGRHGKKGKGGNQQLSRVEDSSLDNLGGSSLQSPFAPESPRNPLSNATISTTGMPMTPGGFGPYSVGPPSVGGGVSQYTGSPNFTGFNQTTNINQNSMQGPNFKPILISTTQPLPQRRERLVIVKYSGNLIEKGDREKISQKQSQIASNNKSSVLQQVLIRPTCISSCSENVINLIKNCWNFNTSAEFICKGNVYCKIEEDFKRNLKFNIKVRVFNIFKYKKNLNQMTNDGQVDKHGGITYDRQTHSNMIEVSLVTPNTGNREYMVLAAGVLKNFVDQMRPLVNLERIF